MINIKNKVVRTYKESYTNRTASLKELLDQGWIVKMCTPMLGSKGETECIEYILEKA